MRGPALSLALAALTAPALWAEEIGDAERGEEAFVLCSGCHLVGAGVEEFEMLGPHLNGIYGRRAGSIEGFAYSEGLDRMGSDGLFWTLETLDAYIENPRVLVSGTRMNFDGLPDAEERADILAYLRLYSDNPRDIPEAEPTALPTDPELRLPPEVLAIEGDAEWGEFLAGECKTCHLEAGGNEGIPSIVAWPEDLFVIAMHAYRRGLRPNPTMQMMTERLSDEEIAALAAYFAQLE